MKYGNRNIKHNDMIIGCLYALGCETLYGLSYMFTKQATEMASEFMLLSWRFIISVLIMKVLIICGIMKIDIRKKNIKPIMMVALFSPCMYFIAETVGISHTTSSESGVFLACIPVASMIASTLILKKKPSKLQMTGILITLAGVVITVFSVDISSSMSKIGYISLFVAVVSYALYCTFVEKASDFDGAEITYIMLVSGAILFTILAVTETVLNGNVSQFITLPFREKSFLMAILYQGIGCSVAAFFLSNEAISKIGVNRTSSFIGVATVVSILAGAVFLKEKFTAYQFIGAIIIISGVYISNFKYRTD